ncbi:MAG: formylglycine-generating enzyme family protein [Gammaproteobacteria bacterium]
MPEQDDAGWGAGQRPAINVSWDDATCFAAWLTKKRGLDEKHRYRLPTESEWEYAARGGKSVRYWWGDEVEKNKANCADCGSEWDSQQRTAPVGFFQKNPLGLYDTAGNVWEWVEDCWHENYEGAPNDGSAWREADDGNCARRVFRGGSWYNLPRFVRSAFRYWTTPDIRSNHISFRLAQDI